MGLASALKMRTGQALVALSSRFFGKGQRRAPDAGGLMGAFDEVSNDIRVGAADVVPGDDSPAAQHAPTLFRVVLHVVITVGAIDKDKIDLARIWRVVKRGGIVLEEGDAV